MKKILLIGTIPPPVGGVSIHIQRFIEQYQGSKGFQLDVLDLKKRTVYTQNKRLSLFQILKILISTDLVHLHLSSNLKILIAFFSKLLGKKVVYTHHNIRIPNIFLFKVLMLFVDRLILVNDNDIDSVITRKYKYQVIPAFLPSFDREVLPVKLERNLEKFNQVISTNCFQMTFIDGEDLYGFDLCVEAFNTLVHEYKFKNTLLVLVDPSGTSKGYVTELKNKLQVKNNCDIIFVGENINFNTLAKKSDIVLRATRSDGDSLTVREALYLNVPIIASDITVRPSGTILFKSGDSKDLSRVIFDVLVENNNKEVNYINIDYGEKVLNIYDSFF